jgi:hypothetical protein
VAVVFFASFRQPIGDRGTFDASRAARDVKAVMLARRSADRFVAARIAPTSAPVPDTADVTQPDEVEMSRQPRLELGRKWSPVRVRTTGVYPPKIR